MTTHVSHNAEIHAALDLQREIGHALGRVQLPEWATLNLSMGQLKALMVLAASDGGNVSALAKTLHVGKPTASILVDDLVQLGYAQRTEDTDDRRRTLVTPTAAGAELASRLRQGGMERMTSWLERLAPDDLTALARGLRALAAIADADTADTVSLVG